MELFYEPEDNLRNPDDRVPIRDAPHLPLLPA